MRLATLDTPHGPRLAAFHDGKYLDFSSVDAGFPTSMRRFLERGAEGIKAAKELLKNPGIAKLEAKSVKLKAPVADPAKIVCVGLNYKDHAAESGSPIPKEPVLFSKYTTALIGPGESIVVPAVSQEVDYEAELVIVIGKRGRHVKTADAMNYVAGYTVGHDVSARDWQLKKDGKQWMVGKTFDTFAPTGPHLVTADEVPDPHALGIRLRLNGTTMQDSNTKQMIFNTAEIVAYISQVFTIEAGDLIFTGTPPGVGVARKPQVFLKGGDVVEVEIDGLGVLRNPVVQG